MRSPPFIPKFGRVFFPFYLLSHELSNPLWTMSLNWSLSLLVDFRFFFFLLIINTTKRSLVSSQNGRFSHFQMGFSLQQGLPNWSPLKMVKVHKFVLSDLLSMHLFIPTNTYLLWHRCFSQQSISKRGLIKIPN